MSTTTTFVPTYKRPTPLAELPERMTLVTQLDFGVVLDVPCAVTVAYRRHPWALAILSVVEPDGLDYWKGPSRTYLSEADLVAVERTVFNLVTRSDR